MNLKILGESSSSLVCPTTKLGLDLLSLEEAQKITKGSLLPRAESHNAKGEISKPAGPTPWVLLRQDRACAYPVVDGLPILLAPEALTVSGREIYFDLTDARYAEAYEEMDFYNHAASAALEKLARGGAHSILPTELAATEAERDSFPAPWHRWVDAPHDSAALWNAYKHLGEMKSRLVVQLGGSGTHAIKFAMAGAAETWLITPILGEALIARALAKSAGFGDRIRCIVAVAEELPIKSETMDAAFAGGCLHHMQTEMALPEAARVLRKGGRFAAAEPWRAPLHAIGTKILGKREDVYCQPITNKRVEPMKDAFSTSHIVHHGTITRYPFLALSKLGIDINKYIPWYAGKIDDAVCSIIPGLRRMGSSIAVLGTK